MAIDPSTTETCYCMNVHCQTRANSWGDRHCAKCGTKLYLQDRYLLTQPLSGFGDRGSNSEVFRVVDTQEEKESYPQIVKILQKNSDDKYIELFQQEEVILSLLKWQDYTFIPRIKPSAYFTVDYNIPRQGAQTVHCLIMEEIQGLTLENWIKIHGTITDTVARNWLEQLAKILKEIHGQYIFHRDIKPSNIMIRKNPAFPEGEMVLIDFGTARRIKKTFLDKWFNQENITKVSSIGYTAPEQEKGHGTPKSDLFSLGRTFIYLCTGLEPHYLDEQHLNWADYARQISRDVRRLINQLVEPDPQKRLANPYVILERLRQKSDPVKVLLSPWGLVEKKSLKPIIISGGIILGLSVAKTPISQWFNDQAFFAYEQQHLEQAKYLYLPATMLNPTDAKPYYGMGNIYEEQGDFAKAWVLYEKAINYADKNSYLYAYSVNNLARLRIILNQDIDQSIYDLNSILSLSEKYGVSETTYRNLGVAFLKKQDYKTAKNYLQKSLNIKPSPRTNCLIKLLDQKDFVQIDRASRQCLFVQ